MKKKIFIIIATILSLTCVAYVALKPRYQDKLAVCAMFKNEAPYLKEWIEYHRIVGVTHFYLYNNDSTDDYLDVLKPYIDQNIVELINWESSIDHGIWGVEDNVFIPYQFGAYNDCLKNRALGKSEWVAVIDIDEFILSVNEKRNLFALLDKQSRKTGSILLYWRCFGTSSVWDLKKGDLLVEKLYQRTEASHKWNEHTKGIHRPKAVQFCAVHDVTKYYKGYKAKRIDPSKFRINHYWTRTQKVLSEKRKMNQKQMENFEKDFNLVNDKSIYQYVSKLKKAMY